MNTEIRGATITLDGRKLEYPGLAAGFQQAEAIASRGPRAQFEVELVGDASRVPHKRGYSNGFRAEAVHRLFSRFVRDEFLGCKKPQFLGADFNGERIDDSLRARGQLPVIGSIANDLHGFAILPDDHAGNLVLGKMPECPFPQFEG